MQGYDLDDTLARVNFAQASVRGLATVYAQADVLYKPTEDFVVITARSKPNAAARQATLNWLKENEPRFQRIYYVPGGNAKNVAMAKARIIDSLNLDSYTSEDREVLNAMKEFTNVPLYLFRGGKKTRI